MVKGKKGHRAMADPAGKPAREVFERGGKAGLHKETVAVCIAAVRSVPCPSGVEAGVIEAAVAALEALRG